jgi:hypothetical protein
MTSSTIVSGLAAIGMLLWAGCGDDGEGGAGGEGQASAASVCLIKLTSSYECSDGDSDHSDPGTWTCRDDFDSLSECESVMVGVTDYADGCIFDTTATEHTWLEGACQDYQNGPPGTGQGGNPSSSNSSNSSTGSGGL